MTEKIRREISIVAIAGLFIFLAAFVYEIYIPQAGKNPKKVEIQQGLGSRQIGELLRGSGIIRSKWTFVVYVSLTGNASRLKPGIYTFRNEPISIIARDLVEGGRRELTITIPEGWTIKEIKNYLQSEGFDTGKEPEIPVERFPYLAQIPKGLDLEGYLFPDTYRIFKNSTWEVITLKMLENFDRKLTSDLRAEIARRNLTTFDVVRMASLLEKEVTSDEDRALVSGILWKRLKLGIGLQVDATVVFAKQQMANRKSQIVGNGKISTEDTKIDSPYNTYKYRGLPIGPISNPGLSAIKAAIYPKDSPYLYYLSAPDGRTIFSKTLEEHNEAKAKYLSK